MLISKIGHACAQCLWTLHMSVLSACKAQASSSIHPNLVHVQNVFSRPFDPFAWVPVAKWINIKQHQRMTLICPYLSPVLSELRQNQLTTTWFHNVLYDFKWCQSQNKLTSAFYHFNGSPALYRHYSTGMPKRSDCRWLQCQPSAPPKSNWTHWKYALYMKMFENERKSVKFMKKLYDEFIHEEFVWILLKS